MLFELHGCTVIEARMRPHCIAWPQVSMMTLGSRRLPNHSTLRHSSQRGPLKLSSMGLPRFAPIDRGGLDSRGLLPLENGVADEFRTAVGTQIARRGAPCSLTICERVPYLPASPPKRFLSR